MLEFLDTSPAAFSAAQIPRLLALQVSFVRLGIHARGTRKAPLDLAREPESNLAGDGASYFTLQFQNVADVAVIAVGPDVCLVARLDQLCSHANALALPPHAAFQQIIHAELSSNLRCAFVVGLVLHGRCPLR